MGGTDYNLHQKFSSEPSWKPKQTQTATTSVAVWVSFGFQLDSLEKKWSA